ncbi:MAG: hypothetical protein HY934_04625 [Candidatus Firestonebacteria bacterium]|nr:hypothetical protein [Candidatus Firestonebacteria bacterium]
MNNLIVKLYQIPKIVLTTKDIALIWHENNPNNLKSKISYYVKQGTLIKLTRGIFSKHKDYNPKELATSIYIPSYISFETVLREAGIIFQHYDTIFIASRWSKTIKCDEYVFTYRKMKDEILYNPTGIINQDCYSIANKERAFLDTIYLFPNYFFDNLENIKWDFCFEFVNIYKNQQLIKRLNKYYKNYAK